MDGRRELLNSASWLTAMLTATATNAPRKFPKSPAELSKKDDAPLSRSQWASVISQLGGGNRVTRKRSLPKYPPREDQNGN